MLAVSSRWLAAITGGHVFAFTARDGSVLHTVSPCCIKLQLEELMKDMGILSTFCMVLFCWE